MMLYFGMDERHEYGVAIVISKKNRNSLLEWRPVNERIIMAKFYSRHIKMTVIQCYAPMNEASDEEKEQLYQDVHDEIAKVPKHDMFIPMKYSANQNRKAQTVLTFT